MISFKTPAGNNVLAFIAIFAIGLIAYSNTFNASFHFDDPPNIKDNYFIKDFKYFFQKPDNSLQVVTNFTGEEVTYDSFKRRIAGYFTIAINYRLHKDKVEGYHITNLAVHIINALLVYFMIILTARTPLLEESGRKKFSETAALFSGLLFVSHPVQTQAVTYIIQRFTSLATLFYLLSVNMYIKSRLTMASKDENRNKGEFFNFSTLTCYFISLTSAVLAMKTKEIAITLPVTITLYEFMFFEESTGKRVIILAPFIATLLIIPLSIIGLDKPLGEIIGDVGRASREHTDMPRLHYLFTQFTVVVTYIRLLFFPVNLNLDYDYPVYTSFFTPQVFLSFIFLLLIFCAGLYLFYRSRFTFHSLRIAAFGIFWFFITLSVESTIIPIEDLIYEHRLYLPSAGAITALVTLFFIAAEKLKTKSEEIKKVLISLVILVIIAFTITSYMRNLVWKDEITLWNDVLKKSPKKARGYQNLGLIYQGKKEYQKGIEMYTMAIALNPLYVNPYNNRGVIFAEAGFFGRAIEDFSFVISVKPYIAAPYNNRGVAYFNSGEYDKAINDFTKVISISPGYAEAYNNRGSIYSIKKEFSRAIMDFTQAIAVAPGFAGFYVNRGRAYLETKEYNMAYMDFKKACDMGNQDGCNLIIRFSNQNK